MSLPKPAGTRGSEKEFLAEQRGMPLVSEGGKSGDCSSAVPDLGQLEGCAVANSSHTHKRDSHFSAQFL